MTRFQMRLLPTILTALVPQLARFPQAYTRASVVPSVLSQWRTCATNADRISRLPDVEFAVPLSSSTSISCVYEKTCAESCSSSPNGACATVCGPGPFAGGACSCSSTPKCGSNCQSCPECSECCCRPLQLGVLEIDRSTTFQTIEGFGGAFTEAASANFFSLSEADQAVVLDAYFGDPFGEDGGPGGHGYKLGRVPINSCDFSPSQFSYDDDPDTQSLPNFDKTVKHDSKQVIPFILQAQQRAEKAGRKGKGIAASTDETLRIFGSPWSPPAWMKNPGGNRPNPASMSGSNEQQGLRTDMQQSWANYLSLWVESFQAKGINIWGITVQNEAEFAAPWEACVYNATFQAEFIGKYLGPTFQRNHPDVHILAYDHNKDHIALWAEAMAANSEALEFLSGIAFHWYVNGPGCTAGTGDCMAEGAANLMKAHAAVSSPRDGKPAVFLLATESCNCPGVAENTPVPFKSIGEGWQRGERLLRDAVSDLNHYSVGYVDWNLLVDYRGGPNHLNNFCDANIVADPERKLNNKTSGAGKGAVVFRPSYYLLGHIARFVPRGSVRIASSFSTGSDANAEEDLLDVVAFSMPNGSTSVILLNRGEQTVEYKLRDKLSGREADLSALPHSAQSFIF